MDLSARRQAYARRLDEAARTAADVLSRVEGVRRVSVFGSYARGRRDLFTDLDLLVVWETDRDLTERARHLYALLDVPVDLDLVCYTPDELRRLESSPFLHRIRAEEVVLYEKNPA